MNCSSIEEDVVGASSSSERVPSTSSSPTSSTLSSSPSTSSSPTSSTLSSSPIPSNEGIKVNIVELVQSEHPKLDLIIVIDTSASMNHHQEKLGSHFSELISGFDGLDWQMAFVSADNSHPILNADGYHGTFYNLEDASGEINVNGNKVKILNDTFSNPQDIFLNTIDRTGKSHRPDANDPNIMQDSGLEAPLEVIVESIKKRNTDNVDFFRTDSTLAVIVLSNEDEWSDGKPEVGIRISGPPDNQVEETIEIAPTQPAAVINAVQDAFGRSKKFITYGIIIEPNDTECLEAERTRSDRRNPNYGRFVKKLANETGGQTESICESDYSRILSHISDHLEARLLLREVPLKYPVIEGSLTVTTEPVENMIEYKLDPQANKIVFRTSPLKGTRITITYQYYNRPATTTTTTLISEDRPVGRDDVDCRQVYCPTTTTLPATTLSTPTTAITTTTTLFIPVNGECGIQHYTCLKGTTPAMLRQEGGFYKWSCQGLHGGTDIDSCQKVIPSVSP